MRMPRVGWAGWGVILATCMFAGLYYSTSTSDDTFNLRLLSATIVPRAVQLQAKTIDISMLLANTSELRTARDPRGPKIAICLVGGLRSFQLTGASIKKYVLDVYDDADVFIISPLDRDVHKITVLSGAANLASIRLFKQEHLNESEVPPDVLTSSGSPHGVQGLLQYFTIVETCVTLIEDYENRHGFQYDWVLRSRVDGYWNRPMPPIESFNPSQYHVPAGSAYGGLNDRLGLGTRNTSLVGLARVSLLPQMHEKGFKSLNSEKAFHAQFKVTNVEVAKNHFPFCILTHRKYHSPAGVPVASIISTGPLDGTKCKPCAPNPPVNVTEKDLYELHIRNLSDTRLCDARRGWDSNWPQVFDEASGSEMAEIRKYIDSRSVDQCVVDMEKFKSQWEIWDAPSAEVLCGKPVTEVVTLNPGDLPGMSGGPNTEIMSSEPNKMSG